MNKLSSEGKFYICQNLSLIVDKSEQELNTNRQNLSNIEQKCLDVYINCLNDIKQSIGREDYQQMISKIKQRATTSHWNPYESKGPVDKLLEGIRSGILLIKNEAIGQQPVKVDELKPIPKKENEQSLIRTEEIKDEAIGQQPVKVDDLKPIPKQENEQALLDRFSSDDTSTIKEFAGNIRLYLKASHPIEHEYLTKHLSPEEKMIFDVCVSNKAASEEDLVKKIKESIVKLYIKNNKIGEGKIENLDRVNFKESIDQLIQLGKKTQLNDLVANFSEVREIKKGKRDPNYCPIYLTTNEQDHELVLEQLKKMPIVGNTFLEGHHKGGQEGGQAILATSGFCGLNMASIRGKAVESDKKIDTIIILDNSINMQNFWMRMKNLMASSSTREEVIKGIEAFRSESWWVTPGGSSKSLEEKVRIEQDRFDKEIKNNLSWLSDSERFGTIKKIFDSNRFIFKMVDMIDPDAMQSIKTALSKSELSVDTLYISNIHEYMKLNKDLSAFKSNVVSISDQQTIVVDTEKRKSTTTPLKQRIITDLFTTQGASLGYTSVSNVFS